MDARRLLEKCRAQQWQVNDLDWSVVPRPMERDAEIAIVQYFTDMVGIERLAKALFELQQNSATDPVFKEIFASFVVDEERHAQVAARLASHYDVHRYRAYRMSPELERFTPHFLDTLRYLPPDVANAYITNGELLLDVALLRSLDDYVHDEMSQRALVLINRDESRHIAMDFHMTEYYASAEYRSIAARRPSASLAQQARATASFARLLTSGAPFFRQVFFRPMARLDPSGKRLREAVKRMQLLGQRQSQTDQPRYFRLMNKLNELNVHPLWGKLLGAVTNPLAGDFPLELRQALYTPEEREAANAMSIDMLAEEALRAKTLH
jgi:hypothetical protein